MDQLPHRLSSWWRDLAPAERRRATILVAIAVGYVAHFLVFCWPQPFFIEDAGITFAYAQNLINGEGFVTYPGGERVEGFSNPLWTFLIAAFYGLGVPVWTSSKVLGAIFGVATLPIVYALVRRARPPGPDGVEPLADAALVAPLMLASSPQFVIWNASGLENAQYVFLLAAGLLRLVQEAEDEGRQPWSAPLFFGVAMSRPEGVMYAAVAFLFTAVTQLRRGRFGFVAIWLLGFAVPFGAWQAWRYWYFAWPHPNTYYAKVLENTFQPFGWKVKGWQYIKNYLLTSGTAWALPLLLVGLVGLAGWRRWVVAVTLFLLPPLLFWDAREGLPHIPHWWRPMLNAWIKIRVAAIGVVAVGAGLCTLTRPGWAARGLMWAFAASNAFFALYSGGDWMKAFRWFSFSSITFLPLLAIGLAELLDEFPHLTRAVRLPARWREARWAQGITWRRVATAVPLLALIGVSAYRTNNFAFDPETAVRDVHRRVNYMSWVQRRLDLDHVTLLDVDMGAHMLFSGWNILDIAGLVDVPIAHHRDYDKKFMREYLFVENRPEFAHVHAGWARSSKIPTHPEWKEQYLEIPGFPSGGRALHVGNHVRRDLFITPLADEPTPAARFAGGVKLLGLDAPAPLVAPGGELHLHSFWNAAFREDGFRVLAVLVGQGGAVEGKRAVASLAPGYDWYKPEEWKRDERVETRFRVPVPESLEPGDYRLLLVLLDEASGQVLRALAEGEADPNPPKEPSKKQPWRDELRKKNRKAADASSDEANDEDAQADGAPTEGDGAEDAQVADAQVADALVADGATAAPPAVPHTWLPGEWDTGVIVRVAPYAEAEAAAVAGRDGAIELASGGRCDEAWTAWKNATRHISRNNAWHDEHRPAVNRAMAGCYVQRAAAAADAQGRADELITGRRYDHHHPELVAQARALSKDFDAQGEAAAANGDWEAAYQAWSTAIKLDPRQSWIRRKAEDARDRRLGIGAYAAPSAKKSSKDDDDAKDAKDAKDKDKDKAEDTGAGEAQEAGEAP